MSTSHSIQGLIKWSQREEWSDDFEAVFERHVGSACNGAGVGLEQLGQIIGDQWMSTLWGCAFEDFVASGQTERNVADDYLKRRGWKESVGTRAYIQALRCSTMSLYEVSDIVVGESFLARDLVRGGEPMRVFERSATRSLSQWDRIAARVVTVLGKTQIAGGVLLFSHQLAEKALTSIERVRKKARGKATRLTKSLTQKGDLGDLASVTGVDEVLAGAAFIFSNLWLDDVLHEALKPSFPQMQNTDGDPLEFITVHFRLISKSKLGSVGATLDGVPSLRKESDAFWNWVEEKTSGRKLTKRNTANRQSLGATLEGGAVLLGNIELTAKAVTLSVNSEARAARGRALLEPILGGLVLAPLVERQTLEQMMASGRPSAKEPVTLPPDEERRIVHQTLTDHYRNMLDEAIPALGNHPPRKAVKTAKGREKVIAWLKMLENQTIQHGPRDPMGSYDFTWIWHELGLADERH
jgi:hypothetical protein